MRTKLSIVLPSKGVPGPLLEEIEKTLQAYYADSSMYKTWGRIWAFEIDLVPESDEDEAEAARLMGKDGERR